MKSYGKYISKQLTCFFIFVIFLLLFNAIMFFGTFYGVVSKDYGETSPQKLLRVVCENCSIHGISDETAAELHHNRFWAMFLDSFGQLVWNVDLPEGCAITISLDYVETTIRLSIQDDGIGITAEKLKELEKPHYMESTDERLDLRHGLGLLLVRQIVEAHGGWMEMQALDGGGFGQLWNYCSLHSSNFLLRNKMTLKRNFIPISRSILYFLSIELSVLNCLSQNTCLAF